MKSKKIFLVETEEGNIILDAGSLNDFNMCFKDQIVLDEEIDMLVDTEMDEGCHLDFIEDYDSEVAFYLSEVTKDSYIELLKGKFDNLTLSNNALSIIQDEVIDRIKNKLGIPSTIVDI